MGLSLLIDYTACMKLWEAHTLSHEQIYRAAIGPLTIWLRRINDELHVAVERESELNNSPRVEPLDEAEPDDVERLTWNRYILAAGSHRIQLRPVMPDRSLVARPESVLELPTSRHARFYIGAPIWIAIEEALAEPVRLVELPTVILSNIWFGTPIAGELCYSLTTRARRTIDEDDRRLHWAVCSLAVKNDSSETLKVQRLRVHAPNLTLYEQDGQLWTNEVSAHFKNTDHGTEIEIKPRPPHRGMTVRSEAREPIRGSVFTRVFGLLKSEEEFQQ